MIKKRNKAILCAIASVAMANSTIALPVSAMAAETVIESRATVTKMEVYNTSSLNIRKGASTKYAILGTASRGQVLEVISISNGWAKINYKNGIGYCSASYLKKVATTTPAPSTKQMIVKVDDLSVRKGAGTSYTKIGSLNKGDKVTVVSELSNGWVKIEFNDGYGYVSNVKGAYLESVSNPSTPSTPDGSTYQYFTTADINLRKSSSWAGEVITVIKKGAVLDVVPVDNNWGKVNYNGNVGYVPFSHLTKMESSTPSEPDAPSVDNRREMIVKVDSLSVRTGSSTSYSKLGELKKGEVVIALETLSNSWVKIEYQGQTAYVSNVKGAYLEEGPYVKDRESANEVIDLIKSLDRELTLDDRDEVVAVRNAYDALNRSAKSLVTNLSVLTSAEAKIAELEEASEEFQENKKQADIVIALIESLSKSISLSDKEAVSQAREAFNALNEKAQAMVTNLDVLESAEAEITRLEEAKVNQEKADIVIGLIDSLDAVIELDDKTAVEEAKAAFDALSPEAQALVTNIDKLTQALTEIERLEKEQTDIETSNEVISIIEEIEALSGSIELGNRELISRARMAYDSLSPEAKALVSAETLKILEDAEAEIKKLEDAESARIVEEKIELLNRDILITDYEVIVSTRAEYEKLSPEAQALVQNLSKLELAEQTVTEKREKYSEVMNLIGNLPVTITLDHKTQVEEARDAFDGLDEDIQDYITTTAQEHYQILTRAEETITRLEEASQVDPRVKSIQDKMDSLMGREITLDDKDTVVQIREEYEALPNELKPQILETLIQEFEMQIRDLEAALQG